MQIMSYQEIYHFVMEHSEFSFVEICEYFSDIKESRLKEILDDAIEKNFLTFENDTYKRLRRTGKSTRIVDEAIQEYFNNGFCIIQAEPVLIGGKLSSPKFHATDRIFSLFMNRLWSEHGKKPYKYSSDNFKHIAVRTEEIYEKIKKTHSRFFR